MLTAISFDDDVFREVYVDHGTLAWPGAVDIAPERSSGMVRTLWMDRPGIRSRSFDPTSHLGQIANMPADDDVTPETIKSALWIDFEGPKDKPPVLLGCARRLL